MTTRANDPDRVPDLLLEQYRLGELPEDVAERLARRLTSDADLRTRLDALDRSDEAIRRQYPPEWLAGQIRLRRGAAVPAPPARAVWRRWALPVAAAVTVGVVAVLMPGQVGRPPVPATERVTLKGSGSSLSLFRRTADGSEALAGGDLVRRGDLLRVGYQAAGRVYGVIVSVDGRGAVTRHLPIEGGQAATLDRGGLVLLDHAYELDDAPRWEAFYFVTSDEPFDVEPVLAAAREAAARALGEAPPTLALPSGLDQVAFMLRKEDTP